MTITPPIDWQFRLGDIYFNTGQEPDDLGCLWGMPTPDGWDSPEWRGTVNNKPFADGVDVSDVYDGARIIHGAGTIVAPTAAALAKAIRRLTGTIDAMSLVDGLFYGRPDDYPDTPDLYCTVRKGGKTAYPARNGPESVQFDFLLNAGDPARYGVTARTVPITSSTNLGGHPFTWRFPVLFSPAPGSLPSTGSSTNSGDKPAPFVAAFHGPLVNPTLADRNSPQRIPLKVSLGAGSQPVIIDTKAQTVTQGSVNVYTYYDDVNGTPLADLGIPAAALGGAAGHSDWVLLGNGSGSVDITNSDVFG